MCSVFVEYWIAKVIDCCSPAQDTVCPSQVGVCRPQTGRDPPPPPRRARTEKPTRWDDISKGLTGANLQTSAPASHTHTRLGALGRHWVSEQKSSRLEVLGSSRKSRDNEPFQNKSTDLEHCRSRGRVALRPRPPSEPSDLLQVSASPRFLRWYCYFLCSSRETSHFSTPPLRRRHVAISPPPAPRRARARH